MNAPTPPRNPWPAVIIGYFVIFISGIAAFTVFAARQQVDLVRPDYYEQEVKYQEQIERLNRTREGRQQLGVLYDDAHQAITLQLPPDQAGLTPTGQVQLYRPSDARLDRSYRLAPDTNGWQSIDARALRAGLWRLRVLWKVAGQEFFQDQPLIVGSPGF